MSSSSPWFTTKKAGRDDDIIKADRSRALQARRAKRGIVGTGTTKKKPQSRPKRQQQRRRQKYDFSSEEEEELILDDDDEEEESDDEDDFEVLSEGEGDEDEDNDDDDELLDDELLDDDDDEKDNIDESEVDDSPPKASRKRGRSNANNNNRSINGSFTANKKPKQQGSLLSFFPTNVGPTRKSVPMPLRKTTTSSKQQKRTTNTKTSTTKSLSSPGNRKKLFSTTTGRSTTANTTSINRNRRANRNSSHTVSLEDDESMKEEESSVSSTASMKKERLEKRRKQQLDSVLVVDDEETNKSSTKKSGKIGISATTPQRKKRSLFAREKPQQQTKIQLLTSDSGSNSDDSPEQKRKATTKNSRERRQKMNLSSSSESEADDDDDRLLSSSSPIFGKNRSKRTSENDDDDDHKKNKQTNAKINDKGTRKTNNGKNSAVSIFDSSDEEKKEVDDDDDDDDDDISPVKFNNNKRRKQTAPTKNQKINIFDESSDDDDNNENTHDNDTTFELQDSDGSSEEDQIYNNNRRNKNKTIQKQQQKSGSKKKGSSSSLFSNFACKTTDNDDIISDEDEAAALAWALKESSKQSKLRKLAKKNRSKKRINDDDFVANEEEANALARAIEESQKESKKTNKNKRKKKGRFDDDDEELDDLIDDSEIPTTYHSGEEEEEEEREILDDELKDSDDEDDQDEDDDDNDDFVDEEEREAGSVLAAANKLSAHVLRSMIDWSSAMQGNNRSDDGGGKSKTIPQGIIVDGAIAMFTLGGKTSNDAISVDNDTTSTTTALTSKIENSNTNQSNHSWISQDLMKKICPTVTLADYQLIGVNWMALLHGMTCEIEGSKKKKKNTNVNGILADEMGLGKTCQTIAFVAWLKYKNTGILPQPKNSGNADEAVVIEDEDSSVEGGGGGVTPATQVSPHLVVVPVSVLANWEREFANFAPHLRVVKYHGSMAERKEIQHTLRKCLPNGRGAPKMSVDVILVGITIFQKEKSDDRVFLRKFNFDYMIIDEAHILKNARGLRYRNLDKFVTNHRLLLTGTPVQNSPKELMSLLCFLMPLFNRSGEDQFGESNNDGGESMLQHFVTLEGGKKGKSDNISSDEAAYRKLKQLFAPFVLRRRKVDVLSQILPPKLRKVELVQLDDNSRTLYDSIIERHLKSKNESSNSGSKRSRGGRGRGLGLDLDDDDGSSTAKSSPEHLFTQLRKAANHPLLLRTRYTSKTERDHLATCFYKYGAFGGDTCTKEMVAREILKYNDFQIHLAALDLLDCNPLRSNDLSRYTLTQDDLFCSSKFVRLRTLLPELISDGHRILIFSVWTSCLDLLGCLLEYLDLSYLRMDGQTPVADRQRLIDRFNDDDSLKIFLLSTKACGLGINLTSADTCIMHDLDFNPFNDLQAEDRCHRIGQKKDVTVIKMVTSDTVDSDIYDMQERKSKMNAAIMDSQNNSSSNDWSKQEKKNKELVLKNAMDRFLKSPPKPKTNRSQKIGKADNGNNVVVNILDDDEEEVCEL